MRRLHIGRTIRPFLRKFQIRRKGMRILLCAAAGFILLWIIILCVDARLRPIMSKVATARVDYLASRAINDAVTTRMSDGKYGYEDLVTFEKDIYGKITALKTDMATVNHMKADITRDVLDAISSIGYSELEIPLGNIINGELLSGRGPGIPIRIVPVGTVSAEFRNVFTEAGINQTRHQIMLNIIVNISVLLPGYTASTTVSAEVNIAETVIVGIVPENYTHFSNSDLYKNGSAYKELLP